MADTLQQLNEQVSIIKSGNQLYFVQNGIQTPFYLPVTQEVLYTMTQDDVDNGYATVKVTWEVPFLDTNYTATFSINDLVASPDDNGYFCGDMHNKTETGIWAIAYLFSPGYGTAGSQLIINAIAIHN